MDNLMDELRQAARDGDLTAVADVVRGAIGEMPFVPQVGWSQLLHSEPGLIATIACGYERTGVTYALEGRIFVTGAGVDWLRGGLGIIAGADNIESLAREAGDNGCNPPGARHARVRLVVGEQHSSALRRHRAEASHALVTER